MKQVETFTIVRYTDTGRVVVRSTIRGEEIETEVDAEGMEAVHALKNFCEKKDIVRVASGAIPDVRARTNAYRNGARQWARMCATFDHLPDVGFMYAFRADGKVFHDRGKSRLPQSDLELNGCHRDATVYVVFRGFTAIVRVGNVFCHTKKEFLPEVLISWETQTGTPGWIGDEHTISGRGKPVDVTEVSIARSLASHVDLAAFFTKMHLSVSLSECRLLQTFHHEHHRGVHGVFPIINMVVDYNRAVIRFDFKDVCTVGQCPPEDMRLPAFFDRVRADPRYWIQLYNHAIKNSAAVF